VKPRIFSIEEIKPVLKAGQIVREPDFVEFRRSGRVSRFSNSAAPYLEAFAQGQCIHDLIMNRLENGEYVNFAEIKETLSTLYWNDDLQNRSAFRQFIENIDGPPDQSGYLADPFFELNLDTAAPALQLFFIGLILVVFGVTYKLLTEGSVLAILLISQTFFSLKTVMSYAISFLMTGQTQALSLHVSTLGCYLKPSSGRPFAISDQELIVQSFATGLLFFAGFRFLQNLVIPNDLTQMFLILATCLCFSPTHNSDVSNFRSFLIKNSASSAQRFIFYITSAAYFAIGGVYLWLGLDIAFKFFGSELTRDSLYINMALLLYGVGLALDMVDDIENLLDRPKRLLPRGLSSQARFITTKVDIAKTLQDVPLLQDLPQPVLNEMAKRSGIKALKAGQKIIRDGDKSTDLYILLEGRVGIYRRMADGRRDCVAQLQEGSIFGEGGFFLNRRRVGDIYALSKVTLLQVGRPPNIDLSQRLAGDAFSTFQKRLWGFQTLANSELFKDTPTEVIREIALRGQLHDLQDNQIVFRQGDLADALWIIVQGTCRAFIDGRAVRDMSQGEIFGEIGILKKSRRSAQIVTVTPAVLLKVDAKHLWEVLSSNLNLGLAIQSVARDRFFTPKAGSVA